MKNFIILCLLIIISACNIRNEDFVFNVKNKDIQIDYSGGSRIIEVESSNGWEIMNTTLVDWCVVEKGQGLQLTIAPNNTFQTRETFIVLKSIDKSETITISQTGIINSTTLDWHTLPVNTISDVQSEGGIDKRELNYSIISSETFISPSIMSKIYHGNLIENIYVHNIGLQEYSYYNCNPITISSFVGGELFSVESTAPSKHNTQNLYNQIKNKLVSQNQETVITPPIQFNSYRHLHILSVGNLGLKLDEIINNKSYKEKEMSNRTGLIYSFSQTLFNITMDMPEDLIVENVLDSDLSKLSYISNIKYGKTAFLVVETDYDFLTSKVVIDKIAKDTKLSASEQKVKDGITANYIFIKEDGSVSNFRDITAISQYFSNTNNLPIIPLSFSISNYHENNSSELKSLFKIP